VSRMEHLQNLPSPSFTSGKGRVNDEGRNPNDESNPKPE